MCHVADREILTVNAALGDRSIDGRGQWETMPEGMPAPSSLDPRPVADDQLGTITERLDQRMIKGTDWEERASTAADAVPGDGQTLMWARIPDVITDVDATMLAILGDFVPMGVGQALGRRGGGNSLDNTLRVCRTVPTDSVLMGHPYPCRRTRFRPRSRPHVRGRRR